MKVRIYNKIKYIDDYRLQQWFIPRQPSKKFIPELQALVSEASEDYERRLQALLQKYGLAFDRTQWCEIRFDKFCDYFFYWFGHSYSVNDKLKCLEIEEEEELAIYFMTRYENYDMQVFDEALGRWRSNPYATI